MANYQIPVQELKNLYRSIQPIQFALIFGSGANGIIAERSDLDIAVLLDKDYNEDVISYIIGMTENLITPVNCDLTILNSAGIVIKFQTLGGKLLYLRNDDYSGFVDFYSLTCREYEDEMAWRKKQLIYRNYTVV